jgi:hypothetical protein
MSANNGLVQLSQAADNGPIAVIGHDVDRAAGLLAGENSFLLSFLVGAIVILFFARKRIMEFTYPPKGEAFDFTKMLTMDTIVGRDVFFKSFVFYVVLLEIIYIFVCTSKPLILLLTNNPSQAVFEGAAWPLGAALIVVGLLPSTPAIAQLEQMLRGLAQRAASIPGQFFGRVTKLSRSEIEALANDASDYKGDLRRFWRIHNLLVAMGASRDQAVQIARRCVSAEVFGQWTLDGSSIWSEEEYDKYKDIISVLKPKSELLKGDVDRMIVLTERLDIVKECLAKNKVEDLRVPWPAELLDSIERDAEAAKQAMPEAPTSETEILAANKYEEVRRGWQKIEYDSSTTSKRLSALFSIIAGNDRVTTQSLLNQGQGSKESARVRPGFTKPDPVLRRFIEILEDRTEQESWSNSAIISCLVGFIICVAMMVPYFYLADLVMSRFEGYKGVAFVGEIGRDGLTRAATIFVGFTLCSVVALFMRSVRIEEGEWRGFTGFATFPFSDYYAIILWCSLAAFVPIMVVYVLNNYNWTGDGQSTLLNGLAPREIAQGLVFRYFLGFSSVAFAIGTCILADLFDRDAKVGQVGNHYAVCLRIFLLIATVQLICLALDANNTAHPPFFLSNFFAVSFFALPAVLAFSRSYRSNKLSQAKIDPPASTATTDNLRSSVGNGAETRALEAMVAVASPAGKDANGGITAPESRPERQE